MSYTTATAVGIVLAALLDLLVLRTRLLTTRRWWAAYVIVVFFQLVTNGWLTGRRIVTYDPDAIIGSGGVPFLGDGRIAWAPVEDLGFGFALVLATCALWVRLGRQGRRAAPGSAAPAAQHPGDGGGPRRP
ncbi:lycopene cyclase domain-containing protein [Lapillicoccus sp.]|uniref:lycopene cyclase domain-containing protein n=1 Tax=Lapillicoccus sp. TaxID=1909287 RepID=UPI0039833F62